MKPKVKPGDTVRVVGERGTAKILSIQTSMHSALLEKQIGGFRRWNLDELEDAVFTAMERLGGHRIGHNAVG